MTTLHRTILEACEAAGFGGEDNSAVIKAFDGGVHGPKPPTFAHLTVATRDVERTAGFYENAMRWPRVPTPANTPAELRAAWVQLAPGQQIHILHQGDFAPSPFEAEFGRHFAVFHPVADFPAAKRRLVEHGGELVDPIRPTPFERFFFRDPNGYMFEVIAAEQYVRE
jgi:predicted enzyme related to lactoylglutathione lyase